ncbi:DUF6506 family protein [Kosmotoga pacifica]|uniref:DUF6506 family protein n=1 Tax=Kosmotoga pacifica TaxID=1330330 RepID=UPI0006993443|nr:DUF6506 family protein [Kosmotoga pacifica]
MAFKVLFLAGSPDAVPEKHRTSIKTEMYELDVVLIKHSEFQQVLEICKQFAENGGDSIILCPGFGHRHVAEIVEVVGDNVAVSVARGDGKSSMIARKAMERAGWFKERKG